MGIAQTVINWKDYGGEGAKDFFFEIILSTDNPDKEVSIDWQIQGDDGTVKRKMLEHPDLLLMSDRAIELVVPLTFTKFKQILIQSGILAVAKNFKERIVRLKKENPKINPAKISDQLLVISLNVLSRFEEKKLTWTKRENSGDNEQKDSRS